MPMWRALGRAMPERLKSMTIQIDLREPASGSGQETLQSRCGPIIDEREISMSDSNLIRFINAQGQVYRQVVEELTDGRKRTHWT